MNTSRTAILGVAGVVLVVAVYQYDAGSAFRVGVIEIIMACLYLVLWEERSRR